MRIATLLAALLLPATAIAQTPAQNAARSHEFSMRMDKLSQIQRYAAIRNAIVENGMWCKRVIGLGYQGPFKNLDMWVARCGPQPVADYGVFVGPDGTVQVSTCGDLVKVKWPACRRLP